MKQTKKILALALTMALALALAVPAFAAGEDVMDSLPPLPDKPAGEDANAGDTERTFRAYQIFSGVKQEDGALYGINWGSAIVDPANFLGELKKVEEIGSNFSNIDFDATYPNRSADAVARIVVGWTDKSDNITAFARFLDQYQKVAGTEIGASGVNLSGGYYLVEEITANPNTPGYIKNLSFLRMREDIMFDPKDNFKVDIPELDKQVLEINDSEQNNEDGTKGEWDIVADYDIGDKVPFVLTGTLPNNYDDYSVYKYVFHDTLSDSLTFNNDVQVWLRNGNEKTNITTAFTVSIEVDAHTFTVTCDDLYKVDGVTITKDSYIQVVYSATLGENATIGDPGNKNTAYLEFSNDYSYKGNGEDSPTGTTPEKIVTVFTFNLVIDKTDEAGEALAGARFTLYKWEDRANKYCIFAELRLSDEQLDAFFDENEGNAVIGDNDATFTFTGLDAGDYKLVETKVPDGYNKVEDMYFTITAQEEDVNGTAKVTSLKVESIMNGMHGDGANPASKFENPDGTPTFEIAVPLQGSTPGYATGTLTTSIVNLTGILLPATGGIGTTIFYVIGGLLVVAAAVLLITKKRVGKQDKPE